MGSFLFLLVLSPWLWLRPSPRLMPIPTTDTATVSATPDTTVLATPDTDTVSDTSDTADTTATARGPLRLRLSPPLPLRLRLIPTMDTTAMDTTVLDTDVPTDTVLDTTDTPVLATTEDTTDTVLVTTARGPLRPSPPPPLRPRLIPTTDTTAMDTTVLDTAVPTDTEATTATEATAVACTDTTVKCPSDSSQPKTILGITSRSSEKWIAQFGLIPTSATSFSATRLAQARNGEQEPKRIKMFRSDE